MDELFKKELMEMAKKRGMIVAEEASGELAELALDVVGLVVAKSENKYDDMVWGAIEGKAREVMAELVDKIDGEKSE